MATVKAFEFEREMKISNVKRLLMVLTAIISTLPMMNIVFAEEHVWKAADGVYRYGPGDGYYSMFLVTDEGSLPLNLSISSILRGC